MLLCSYGIGVERGLQEKKLKLDYRNVVGSSLYLNCRYDMIPTIEYKLQKPLESQYRGFLILLF